MKKSLLLLTLISIAVLPFCTTSKKTVGDKKMDEPSISYTADIAPIFQAHCSPCHFPDGGKLKFLDSYAAVTNNIDDILFRVQLPQDSIRFMPFKQKKEPLNDSLIQVIKYWKDRNMPKD